MEETLKYLKALSDPIRLRIMLLLIEEELCVCELESVLAMEQSRISHALRVLREAGLIDERRDGRWIFYSTKSDLSPSLLDYLEKASADDDQISADRKKARKLLESAKPSGKRCPLREGK